MKTIIKRLFEKKSELEEKIERHNLYPLTKENKKLIRKKRIEIYFPHEKVPNWGYFIGDDELMVRIPEGGYNYNNKGYYRIKATISGVKKKQKFPAHYNLSPYGEEVPERIIKYDAELSNYLPRSIIGSNTVYFYDKEALVFLKDYGSYATREERLFREGTLKHPFDLHEFEPAIRIAENLVGRNLIKRKIVEKK